MTARASMTLREFVTGWKWLILPLGGILFALTVIFPRIPSGGSFIKGNDTEL